MTSQEDFLRKHLYKMRRLNIQGVAKLTSPSLVEKKLRNLEKIK
jgi:hypothetical protein